MWIQDSGQITPHVEMLNVFAFPCFWIQGQKAALVDAGTTALSEVFEDRFGELGRRLDHVLVTHSHYDHVGGLGVLRGLCPALSVLGSTIAQETLGKDKVQRLIIEMNREEERLYNIQDRHIPLDPASLRIDEALADGQILDLGNGVSIEAHHAPGHTRCSMVYLVKPDAVLLGGESLGGYVSPDEIQTQAASSFQEYLTTLERLARLPFEAIGLPHHGILTGDDARRFIPTALRCAIAFRAQVLELHHQGQSVDEMTLILTNRLRHGVAALQPEKTFGINLRAMIQVLLKEENG